MPQVGRKFWISGANARLLRVETAISLVSRAWLDGSRGLILDSTTSCSRGWASVAGGVGGVVIGIGEITSGLIGPRGCGGKWSVTWVLRVKIVGWGGEGGTGVLSQGGGEETGALLREGGGALLRGRESSAISRKCVESDSGLPKIAVQ